ncbi:hypothetical protein PGT21_022034 [Puccinia graminis f. sp. tritici]|uniref:Uncharacterized protein n=1 Tax=Puccinia graminis f. sp. tritici TaxID=56615 RepID=A0A5B0Q380_PUCGR|nr:hypothetical protein PGT21_022034 [Puccinia graminis f. sp. tritici]KAA1124524.1 hypothetical protein PGTUg99_007129 [Puccinia graminis f. sp. tritici]
MQFPSALAFITLLVAFPLAMHAQNLPNDYILKDKTGNTGYLDIFNSHGKLAFRYTKTRIGVSSVKSATLLQDGDLRKLFSLYSNNDECQVNTVFIQNEIPYSRDNLPKRSFSFDARGFGDDVWRFNLYDNASSSRRYFKFKKNRSNKGGEVFRVARGQPDVLVARLRNQKRRDNWLDPNRDTGTFTLSTVDGAPLPELAIILASVFIRDWRC